MALFCSVELSGAMHWNEDERPLKRTYVVEATDYGLQKMNELVNIQEPHLYQIGMWLERDNPARYVAAFNSQSEVAKRLAKFGYASLQATTKLVQHLYTGVESRAAVEGLKLPTISLLHTALHDQCPLRSDQVPSCPENSGRYRTADGRCNNPAHPWWGASMMPLHRFLPSHYRDGLEKIRMSVSGGPLPSARLVSSSIHSDRNSDLTSITHMVMQWGQFLDHDLTSSAQTRGFNGSVPKCCIDGGRDFQPLDLAHPDCMAIPVPPDDWFYSHYGVRCLEFVRSSPTSRMGCSLGPRDQINQVTSFIDASAVYGSSEHEEDSIRMFRNGLLKYSRVQYRLPLLPAATYKADLCRGQSGHVKCFQAGDKRVNEQPGLIALHTIWLRAHNKIATELSHINPHWRDEKLYQETRRIIGAIMQHITFKEFLPIVLGRDVMKLFDLELMRKGYFTGYDIKTNPTAANAFGTAAFRFGHSLVQHSLMRCDRSHHRLLSNVSLHEELTNPSNLYNIGSVDRLLLGLCQQPAQKRDEFITEELTNHLFQTPRYGYGMDLAALNIQRGRDHGLAPYNAWREPCGLQPFNDWPQMLKVMSTETQRKLKYIYRDVDDIDLFPGAMAERPVAGGLVGPTFACILAQQFSNLRKGDRFWYENGGFESSFTLAQLQQIRRVSLARILCDNLDGIDTLQPFVFLTVDNDQNHRVPCDSDYIPYLDLKPWAEHHKEENYHHEIPSDHHPSPSHHKPSYPSYHKPPTKQTPSYHHTTRPSHEEHKPSYLIDFESEQPTKPHEENKPSYLIDNQFQGKPTKPQNMYTTSRYPKPDEGHKPTYLIDENFQETEKRPFGGHKPSNSDLLPLEHKEPNYSHHDHDHGTELPNKLQTKPSVEYHHHHHEEEYSSSHTSDHHPDNSKPHEEYYPHHKPQDEYPNHHHKPHDEYPVDHKPHDEHHSFQKPYDEHPSHSKPQYEHTTRFKPHYDLTTKPHYEFTNSRPYYEHSSHSKPYYEHTTHLKPHYEHTTESHYEFTNSKPHYSHTTHSKPYHEQTTSYYKPQYVYTFNKPYTTPSSKPHYEHTSFTKPYDHEHIPSTLDYNKYKPRPSKPNSYYDGSYSIVTHPPHKEHHHSGSYSSVGRPSYQKPSSGYHATSYSYIKLFNEPSYYYLEDGKMTSKVNQSLEKIVPKVRPERDNLKGSLIQYNNTNLDSEPRTSMVEDIPADFDDSTADITTFISDTSSVHNETVDIVTIEGNVVTINEPSSGNKKITIISNKINVTLEHTDVNNTEYNSNITYDDRKQENIVENNTTETSTEIDDTNELLNRHKLDITKLSNTTFNATSNTYVKINTSVSNDTTFGNTSIHDSYIPTKQIVTNITDVNVNLKNITDFNTFMQNTTGENNSNVNVNSHAQLHNPKIKESVNSSDTKHSNTTSNTTLNLTKNVNTNNANNVSTITETTPNIVEPITMTTDENISTGMVTETNEETTVQYDITVHSTLSDNTISGALTASSHSTTAKDEWIFTEEEEISTIPEMPSLASDPMALKELPRPMTFDDEESSRGLV